MKKILIGLLLGAMLFLVGCKDESDKTQESKVAVLNMGLMFQTSKASQAAMEYMTKVEKDLQEELEKAIQNLPKGADGNVVQDSMPQAQKLYAEVQQRYNAEQQMVLTRLNTLATETVDEYRTQHNMDVIIRSDQTFSFNPAIDVTEAVIALMNTKEISFAPMLPEAPQGTAAGNATAPAPASNATAPASASNATAPAN